MRILLSALLLAASVLLMTETVHASVEAALPLSSFELRSEGTGGSGPVIIRGRRNGDDFVDLCFEALQRATCLQPDHLNMLKGALVNSVQISYEGGYQIVGGRTIYILLGLGFTLYRAEGRLIVLNERGVARIDATSSQEPR